MQNFKRFSGGNSRPQGGGGFNKGGFSGRSSGGRDNRRDGGRPEMFRATCADCGNSCEVPFRPTGERPVYCSNCFGGKREGSSPAGAPRRDFSPHAAPSSSADDRKLDELKRQIESLHQKLDKVFTIIDVFIKKQTEKEVVEARKPMATPEFYKAIDKIESAIESKKKIAVKKVVSKKKK